MRNFFQHISFTVLALNLTVQGFATAVSINGKVDNLHIQYDGNRITTVLEETDSVTHDYPGGNPSKVMAYNGFGILVPDGGRRITSVSYDGFGNPVNVPYEGNSSVTNVCSATDEKLKTVAYYPYGGVIPDISTNPTTVQPYKFGGKELITANGLNEYDFGARQYYSAVPGFTKPDPMCEKYYWLSPYLYCANNPVNLTDPTGMFIVGESRQEWNRNRKDIEKRLDGLQKSIDNVKATGARKGWSQDRIDKKIGDRQERVASLDNTLSTMTTLENSEQGYSLSSNHKSSGMTSLKDGIIDLEYGSMAMFCHEVTHAGQFESGDIAFNINSGNTYLNDVFDESAAFRSQYAYDPNTVNGLNPNITVSSIADISPGYVMGIQVSNGLPYAPGGANNVGSVMVRIDSPVERLLHAFPNHIGYIEFVNSHSHIRQLPNIYYKR